MRELKYNNTTLDLNRQKKGQLKHNKMVKTNGKLIVNNLNQRLAKHDKDKLLKLDVWARFQIVTDSGFIFGTKEYNKLVKTLDIDKVLLKHRKENPHHPEFFKNDFSKMTIMDLTELIADWYTANSTRPSGAKLEKMLNYQQKTYGFSDDIKNIIENTMKFLEQENKK